MSILIVGDSSARKFEKEAPKLSHQYDTHIDVDCSSERDLMEVFNNLSSLLKPSHRDVLVMTFISEFWELAPLNSEYNIKVFYPKPNVDIQKIKDNMTMIAQLCKLKESELRVWFVFPPIMDVYKYNQSCLFNYPKLLTTLQNHDILNAENMSKKSREFHHLIYSLQSSHSEWGDDNRHLKGQSIIYKYNQVNDQKKAESEVLRYIKGESHHLDLPDLLPDGMHPSSNFVYQFFKYYSNFLKLKVVTRSHQSAEAQSRSNNGKTVKTLSLGPEIQDPLIKQFIERELEKLIEKSRAQSENQCPSYTDKILKTIVAETIRWEEDETN